MNEINRVLSAASRRVAAVNFLRGVVITLTTALAVLILLRVAQQLAGFIVQWKTVAYASGGVCLLGGIIWSIMDRPSRLSVARQVDEGANLKESLSTALCVADRSDDPWARATLETATRQARGVRVSQAVPVSAPRFWPVPLALGLSLAVIFLAVPRMDLFKWEAARIAKKEEQAQIVQAKQEAIEVKEKIQELTQKLDLAKDKTESPQADKPEARTPEEIRKAALKDLTKLNDRLEELRNSTQAQKLGAMQQQLKQLKATGDKTAELTKAMSAGNFAAAKQELEKLKEQAQGGANSGGMSEGEKKATAKQLEELAKQLDKLAENQDALAKQLEAAGLDKALAKDPSALEKALQAAQNLSADQKQQLQQAAQAMSQCKNASQGLAQAMQKMADAMQQGDSQGMQQSSEQAEGQLSELEQLSQDMAQAAAAQSECQAKMSQLGGQCQGNGQCNGDGMGAGDKPWSEGWNESRGQGSRGGPGIGKGGSSSSAQADFGKEDRKSIGELGQGPIVGTRLVEGESIRGESRAQFAATVAKGEQSATEAIENNTVPREYHEAIKSYFGRLKSRSTPPSTKPAQDAAPAAPAKDADK